MVFGLVAAVILASGSAIKAIAMVMLGLLLGIVGTDVNSGQLRYTMGLDPLSDGIGFVGIAMGLFGIGEIMKNLEQPESERSVMAKIERLWPTMQDFHDSWRAVLRGTAVGTFLGVLPGGGALLASFAAYTFEKRIAKDPSRFGKGAIEGVAAPESANNAGAQTSFIPLLTLGIPSNALIALMAGAMMIHGIAPGPQVMTKQPELYWGLIASMWIGNLMLVIINLPLIGIWVTLLKVPYRLLYLGILMFCCIGAYSVNNATFDIYIVAALRRAWLRLYQARMRTRADDARIHPRPADGREFAPLATALARRLVRVPDAADQRNLPGDVGRTGAPDRVAEYPQEPRRGVQVGGLSELARLGANALEQQRRQIALREGRHDRHDRLAGILGPQAQRNGGGNRGTR